MHTLRRLLVGNDKNIMRQSAIWNLVSSVEYSLQSAILLLVITRAGGLFDAGVFTIAYTFTQMMATVGSYGMRSFQVSDVKTEYKFGTYLYSRLVTITAMIAICVAYSFMQRYDNQKFILVLLLCMYRVVDDFEDVFHGEMQKKMRLDIASKIVAIRILISTVMFALVYVVTHNLIYASLSLTITAIIVSIILNVIVRGEFQSISLKVSNDKVIQLLWTCLPICLSGFLYNYLANASKYAIDRNLSEEVQTIFSILFMPIFVINMLSSFVFKPMIASMGVMWVNGQHKEFIKTVVKQLLLIIGMTVVIMLLGVLCGIDILGWLYGVRITQYRILFALLLAFGGFAAIVAFLVVVLTIVRKQKYIIVAYGISAVVNLLFADYAVIQHEIWGAGIMYGITMGLIMFMLSLTLLFTMYKVRRNKNDNSPKENIS